MDMKQLITRARRGLREEMRLYLVAVSSLAVAFLCLGGALLALTNLSAIAQAWGQSSRMTVYLRDGAEAEDRSSETFLSTSSPTNSARVSAPDQAGRWRSGALDAINGARSMAFLIGSGVDDGSLGKAMAPPMPEALTVPPLPPLPPRRWRSSRSFGHQSSGSSVPCGAFWVRRPVPRRARPTGAAPGERDALQITARQIGTRSGRRERDRRRTRARS